MKKLMIFFAGVVLLIVIARVMMLRYQDRPENFAGLQECIQLWKERVEAITDSFSEQFSGQLSVQDWEIEENYDIDTEDWFVSGETILSGSREYMQLSSGQVNSLVLQAAGCSVEIVESEDADIYLAFENMKKVQAYQKESNVVVKAVRDTELKQEPAGSVLRLYLPSKCHLEEAELELGAGSLKIENIHAGKLKLSVEAGKLTAEALCAETLVAALGAGMILLEQAQVQDAKLSAGAGSMVLKGQIHGDVDAECTVGGLQLHLQGDVTDFNYEVQCVAGNIQIGDEKSSGINAERCIDNGAGKRMELDCAMGNLEVSFSQGS